MEAFAFLALVTVFGMITGNKVVEVRAGEWIGTQGKVLVGAQVVDPQVLDDGLGCCVLLALYSVYLSKSIRW